MDSNKINVVAKKLRPDALRLVDSLCNAELEVAVTQCSGLSDGLFIPTWLDFCTRNAAAARKHCFEIRKRGVVGGVVAYYLSKTLYNLDNVRNLNVFAWCAISAIKGFQQESFTGRVDYRSNIETIVKELCSLKIEPKSESDQILVKQIRHYQTVWLASEEHLAEAFETQRAKYLADPQDFDNLRGLGWTLHDCIKQACEALKSRKLVEFFSSELRRLNYPVEMREKDPKLVHCYDSDLKKAETFLNGTGEVVALTRGGDLAAALIAAEKLVKLQPLNSAAHYALAGIYDKMLRQREALREYLLAVKNDPESERNQVGAAWSLVKFVNACVRGGWKATTEHLWPRSTVEERVYEMGAGTPKQKKKWEGSDSRIILLGMKCIDEWTKLPKPSKVYSQLLRSYTRIVKDVGDDVPQSLASHYLNFVGKWDLKNLTDDDSGPRIPNDTTGKAYPSLFENVVGAIYKCAVQDKDFANANQWVLDFVGSAVERFPDRKWFPYYYGKLLLVRGRSEEARKYIIKVAQLKMSESWAWQTLAETYPENKERQLACLCRALLCNVRDESYQMNVHESLGWILKDRGYDAEALREFDVVDAVRAGKKWKRLSRGVDFSQWRLQVKAAEDNEKLYRQWAANADALVLEDLPGIDGVITARYRDRDRNVEVARVWWMDGRRQCEVKVNAAKHSALMEARPGAPVRVWSGKVDGRDTILKLEMRVDGNQWDVFPKRPGIVVDHDGRRGCSIVVIGDGGETCTVDWKGDPSLRDVAVGSVCELAMSTRPTGATDVNYIGFPENPPIPVFAMEFSGELRLQTGRPYGFVGDDVFVPEHIVGDAVGGTPVKGVAARSYDKTKNRIGWKAVTMEAVK